MSVAAASVRHGAPGLDTAVPSLWADRGCPFAHRVRALCHHLDWALDLHEFEVGEKPPGLSRYSPSGRIPLLVHGALVTGESRVMLEHVAEHRAFADALPPDLTTRTLHREAMAIVDDFIVPRLTRTSPETHPARLEEILDVLERATASALPGPCLLTFHVAPMWLRVRWWNPEGAVSRGVEARPALRRWLDAAIELESVARTSPDRGAHVADLRRLRERGALAWERPGEPGAGTSPVCTLEPEPTATRAGGNDHPRSQS